MSVYTRGPVVFLYEYNRTLECVYRYKGAPVNTFTLKVELSLFSCLLTTKHDLTNSHD